MKIQYLNGGLANQTFQYIFARFGELYGNNSEPWYLDDSFFFVKKEHNGYELEKVFGLHPNLLSRYFDEDVWNALIDARRNGVSIPQSLKNFGLEFVMIAEYPHYVEHVPFDGSVYFAPLGDYQPQLAEINCNIYYFGYWINRKWMDEFQI